VLTDQGQTALAQRLATLRRDAVAALGAK